MGRFYFRGSGVAAPGNWYCKSVTTGSIFIWYLLKIEWPGCSHRATKGSNCQGELTSSVYQTQGESQAKHLGCAFETLPGCSVLSLLRIRETNPVREAARAGKPSGCKGLPLPEMFSRAIGSSAPDPRILPEWPLPEEEPQIPPRGRERQGLSSQALPAVHESRAAKIQS
jgi:hypothetical protein